ncbi:hypothetical protein GCM10023156_05190 [Novipirellula rosea]|uniref:Uncharacterized protein n=1 Tax=Novipirellula rosea TaxID=1031540 RepID=A0ABP8M6R5_9BACT
MALSVRHRATRGTRPLTRRGSLYRQPANETFEIYLPPTRFTIENDAGGSIASIRSCLAAE